VRVATVLRRRRSSRAGAGIRPPTYRKTKQGASVGTQRAGSVGKGKSYRARRGISHLPAVRNRTKKGPARVCSKARSAGSLGHIRSEEGRNTTSAIAGPCNSAGHSAGLRCLPRFDPSGQGVTTRHAATPSFRVGGAKGGEALNWTRCVHYPKTKQNKQKLTTHTASTPPPMPNHHPTP